MARDPLDGWFISTAHLTKCVNKIKESKTYVPSVLILSEQNFHSLLMAIAAHNYKNIVAEYKQLGIVKVVWAEDINDGEFMLSSELGIPTDVERILL